MDQNKTFYNLTSAQKLLLYSQKFCIKKCVNNIATSILLRNDLDFELLKKSIKEAVNRNDAMRLRLLKSKEDVKQYFIPSEDKEVEFKDFTGCTEDEMEKTIHKWAGQKFKLYEASLNRIVMFKSYDNWCGIFMNVHHTTMDSYSIMMFYKDVMDIYFSYKNMSNYPKPLSSYIDNLQKELKFEENSKAKQSDIDFWQEKFNLPEPIYTDSKGSIVLDALRKKTKNSSKRSASIVTLLHVNAKHEIFSINKLMKEKMVQFCLSYKVSMQSLILMTLRTYLSKMNKDEKDISITATVARRGTIDEKRSGGTRVLCFPFRTIIENDKTFVEGVSDIRDSFNQNLRHSNLSFMQIIDMRRKAYGITQMDTYESMSLTYSPVQIKFDDIECRSKWYCNGAASQNLYLTVMHNIQTSGLDFYFEYKVFKYKPIELQNIFNYMYKILEMGVENPEIKISELLSIQSLEDIVNESGSVKASTFA